MYTILMNENKELIQTKKRMILQYEKLADKFLFLIPTTYDSISLIDENLTVYVEYIGADSVTRTSILAKLTEDLYDNSYMQYGFPIDTEITRYSGSVSMRIGITWLGRDDGDAVTQYVIKSYPTTINVHPLTDFYNFIPDESLSFVDQTVAKMQAQVDALNILANDYKDNKADNLAIVEEDTEKYLTLMSGTTEIGNKINVVDFGEDS